VRIEIRICGLGGQGVILAGEILGLAAVLDGKYAVQTRSYGSEARGTACKSDVIISSKKVHYPLIEKCDIMIAMNNQSLNIYAHSLKKNGILVIDSDLVKHIPSEIEAKIYGIRATKIAEEKFTRIVANMILLGFTAKITGIVTLSSLEKAIRDRIPKAVELNLRAIREGARIAENYI